MKNGSITSPCLKSSSLKSSINWEISCRSCQRFWGKQAVRSPHPGHSGWPTFSHWMFGCENGSIRKVFQFWYVLLGGLCMSVWIMLETVSPYFEHMLCHALPPCVSTFGQTGRKTEKFCFAFSHQVAAPARGPRPDATPSCVTVQRPTLKQRKKRLRLTSWSVVSFLSIVSTNINCNQLEN